MQDVPVIIPIDQSAVVKAVTIDSKLKTDLYTSLGKDVNKLKKTIANEITRGIASGMLYDEITRNIKNASGVSLRRARTITRTEAGRVQEQATYDAAKEAKAVGADVVKQWSAIRDAKTRDTHRMLDGQVREVDEYFTVSGHKALHPHGFGVASEDINCRCTMLTRARSALGEADLKKMQERAAQHGLLVKDTKKLGKAQAKNIAEFKEKYLKAAETLEKQGVSRYNIGAISGAYNDSNDPDWEKRNAHADQYYASLRNSKKTNVVEVIARNAGVESILVSRMYDHLIVNEYELDGEVKRFDTSYDIAQSLQRLREGKNIQEHDLILIHHEATEYVLMNRDGLSYDEAHEKANEKYDYATALKKFLKQKDGE